MRFVFVIVNFHKVGGGAVYFVQVKIPSSDTSIGRAGRGVGSLCAQAAIPKEQKTALKRETG
ncbi:MAG: hypothetical protein ACLRSW_03785 [Christensenellaceae bacterium]